MIPCAYKLFIPRSSALVSWRGIMASNKIAAVRTFCGFALALTGVVAFVSVAEAGLIINPTFDSSITSDPNAALIEATINQAVNAFEAAITTPVTVNILYSDR